MHAEKLYPLPGNVTDYHFKKMIKHCIDLGASDILVQSGDYIWAEIHGRQFRITERKLTHSLILELIPQVWDASEIISLVMKGEGADRSLVLYGEDLGLKRGEKLRLRCNFVQAQLGEVDRGICITMRTIPNEIPDIETMELDEELLYAIKPEYGLVLVCGPTGSGKSTLLASIYKHIMNHKPDSKIITIEDPIEFNLGVSEGAGPIAAQSELHRDVMTFEDGIRMAMRRKPTIIGIGEARDASTIGATMLAAETGHLCFSTVHTESVAETINRLVKVFPAEQHSALASMLLGVIRVIIIQRLVKTVDGKRKAIREYMIFDREMREKLQDAEFHHWGRIIRKELEANNATLEDRFWDLYVSGTILKEDFIQVAGLKSWNRRTKIINDLQRQDDNHHAFTMA